MKCLLIYRDRPYLLQSVKDWIENITKDVVCTVETGLQDESEEINSLVLAEGQFGFILHHCGVSNDDYDIFINKYTDICKKERWTLPVVLLITGGSVDAEEARELYADHPMIHVAYMDAANAFFGHLRAFLEEWCRLKWSVPPPWGYLPANPRIAPVCGLLHPLSNLLVYWPNWPETRREAAVTEIQDAIRYLNGHPDVWSNGAAIELVGKMTVLSGRPLTDKAVRDLNRLLSELQGYLSLTPNWEREDLSEANLPKDLKGRFRTILVADDEGYPVECIRYLEKQGYWVKVEQDYAAAESLLASDPPSVFLCDMTFGNVPDRGCDLMRMAAQQEPRPFIIALSGSRLCSSQVSDANAICDGTRAKTEMGARWVHKAICLRAG